MDINTLLKDLSWNAAIEEQKKAVDLLTDLDDYDMMCLVHPIDKSCWENASQVLKNKGVKKTYCIVNELFEMIQDINWPGAHLILDLLKSYPKGVFMPAYENAIMKAYSSEDDLWLAGLAYFIYCNKVIKKDFLDPENYRRVMEYFDFWG
mgnify:CR=1 FL=1